MKIAIIVLILLILNFFGFSLIARGLSSEADFAVMAALALASFIGLFDIYMFRKVVK